MGEPGAPADPPDLAEPAGEPDLGDVAGPGLPWAEPAGDPDRRDDADELRDRLDPAPGEESRPDILLILFPNKKATEKKKIRQANKIKTIKSN